METIYLFHDREESPDKLEKLEEILKNALPPTNILRPYLPHIHPGLKIEDSYHHIMDKFDVSRTSAIIGVGWGGLLAAKLQEDLAANWNSTPRHFKVIALAAPTMEGNIVLTKRLPDRRALYSSQDKTIQPRTNWSDFAEAYEYTPLLFHDIEANSYMLAYLIKTWLSGKNVEQEILSLK